jgi:hypothetical protein
MQTRFAFSRWSIIPATGWRVRPDVCLSNDGLTKVVELIPASSDSSLRLTPDDREFDAAEWIELVALANRQKGRSISSAHCGALSGCSVEFAARDEWLRGWALTASGYPLDVSYRCQQILAGRDDDIVESMLDSLRLEFTGATATVPRQG